MELFAILFSLLLLFTCLVLPWINKARCSALREDVEELRRAFANLSLEVELARRPAEEVPRAEPVPPPPVATQAPVYEERVVKKSSALPKREAVAHAKPERKSISFEQQFGARLPVWIGGIALALAGFFLVKYTIEIGLFSPAVRIATGVLFGLGLLGAAQWVRQKNLANGVRIAQSLSGAGIADLYVCIFAATNLYGLLPPQLGFAGMALITLAAVSLSLLHGAPIALLGLIGGFLTPALISSNEVNTPLMFLYLYMVLSALLAVISREKWWILAIPTIFGAFAWVGVWIATVYQPADSLWLGMFLIAMSASLVLSSKKAMERGEVDITDAFRLSSALNYLALGGAVLMMGVLTVKADFGLMEWSLFGLLSAGGMLLAFFNPRLYGFVPWLAMGVNAVMLATWAGAPPETHGVMIGLFGALYTVGGFFLMWRAGNPVSFAALSALSALVYYLIGYGALHNFYPELLVDSEGVMIQPWPVWGLGALGLGILAVGALTHVMQAYRGDEVLRQRLLAIFALATAAFVSIGLTIELKREFLSVAFAAEVFAVSWIATRIDLKALRGIAGLLAVAFALLLTPQIILLVQLTAYSLAEVKLALQDGIPIVNWPLFQLGVPAAFLLAASYLLRKGKDDTLVHALEVASVALVGVMGYYLTRHGFHANENILFVKAGFLERGVITNVLFVYGLGCLFTGRLYQRQALTMSGAALCGIALFRIFYFDLLIYNPLIAHQKVTGVPVLNTLMLPFGLPLVWLALASRELEKIGQKEWANYTAPAMLAGMFALVTLNVRFTFQGEYLYGSYASNAEIYTYSVVWLLMGIGLLFLGTLKKEKTIRVASLLVMILTVGKVFLYDASELEGLLRVFSFLGLGLSLIGLSWFYTRFVFVGENRLASEGE